MSEPSPSPTGLPPAELARWIQGQLTAWIEWSAIRRARFRRAASIVRLTSMTFAIASTVILGLQNLNFWASLAFSLGAVGAAVSAVEPFFNWRARWVLLEETEARLRRIKDELDYFLARTAPDCIGVDDVDRFFRQAQEAWVDASRRWVDQRHADQRDT